MIVTVFRSRLMPDLREEYVALVDRMVELAATIPGYISHKGFFAEDGRASLDHSPATSTRNTAPHRKRAARSIIPNTAFRCAI